MKKVCSLIFSLCLTAQLTCQQVNWTNPPDFISSPTTAASDPQIGIDTLGNEVSVWVENGSVKARSKPYNGSWGTTNSLSVSGMASAPRLNVDPNGNAAAIWLDNGIVKAAYLPLNGSWSSVTNLSSSGASSAGIGGDTAGNVIAIWSRNGSVQTATKLFNANWGAAVTISGSSSSASPAVAIGNGTAVAVWYNTASSIPSIFASTKSISGNWAAGARISTSTINSIYPAITVDGNGNATAAWFTYNVASGIYSNVVVQAVTRPSGGSWGTPTFISTAGLCNPADLALRVDSDTSNDAIAVWTRSPDGASFVIEAAVKSANSTWQPSKTVISQNTYASAFDLAVNSFGNAFLINMDFDSLVILSSQSDIFANKANQWGSAFLISAGVKNGFPKVAASKNGNTIYAAAVWVNYDGNIANVQTSNATGSIMLPPSNLVVSQSVNNFGIFNEYVNTLTWTASTSPNVAQYLIFRDGMLIATATPDNLQFIDHNRHQNATVTYGIAAVDNDSSQSAIVNVTFP